MTPTLEAAVKPTPELLYLLCGDPVELSAVLASMQPPDIAEALRELEPAAGAKVLAALPFDLAVRIFDEPELVHVRAAIIAQMPEKDAADLVEAMSADQQADLFRELPPPNRNRLLSALSRETRDGLRLLLQFPPETAGGIMTTEFVSVPADWTVERTLAHVRQVGGRKETVYAIYVTDPATQGLVHVVSLRELVMADPSASVKEVGAARSTLSVGPQVDREEVARLISKYNLLAMPVVDEQQRLLGIVTVDDVIDALVKEETEDVQKFGGMAALDQPYIEIGLGAMVKKRAGWLCALFLGEMLTASAMGYFEHEIQRAVMLALFIPLIISSGGNTGSQATSLIIRAIALREVTLKDWWRVALRELPTGAVLGAMLGVLGVIRVIGWQLLGWQDYGPHYPLIAVTVGGALFGVVTFGSLTGSMLPFLLRRLGADPASASAPFVATLVDVSGIVIYFGLAALLLRGTLL
ncbi:MAG TPA: magnesium transporter [Gemmatimonadales bacterium]|jgi:magnesium transporter|nr:magnesium transporter [Gemmatimonadales bacterium]